MKMKIGLLYLSLCFTAAISMSIKDSIDEPSKDYERKVHKTYTTEDEPIRKAHFKRNVEKINSNNERFANGEVSYKMDINSFTDKDSAYNKMQLKDGKISNVGLDYPESYDGRNDQNFLSPVPNIGDCKRADWAFAAVGMLEGYLYKKEKNPIRLSVQDLIECSEGHGNGGCNGGDIKKAFEYITANGISPEALYPFNATPSECSSKKVPETDRKLQHRVIDVTKYDPAEESEMKEHIFNVSPLTAIISTSVWNQFSGYKGGIFTKKCNPNDDAEDANADDEYNVLIVGYDEDEEKSQKYWIVKNWLGENWGERGYAKVASNVNTAECGGPFSKIKAITTIK